MYKTEAPTGLFFKPKHEPYLTLFHADISLAFSLSISSGSPVASLPESVACGVLRPKLPCRSRGCCLRLPTRSSCIIPPTYWAALGETEFMPLNPQSQTLLLRIATQNWGETDKTRSDQVNYWLIIGIHILHFFPPPFLPLTMFLPTTLWVINFLNEGQHRLNPPMVRSFPQ